MTKSIKEKMTQLRLLHKHYTNLRKERMRALRKREHAIIQEYKRKVLKI